MAQIVNKNVDSGLLKFTFTDSDGEIFSHFMMNPADAALSARCNEVSEYFANAQNSLPENPTVSEIAKCGEILKEKLDYLLGYKASETMFNGIISPTTVTANGDLFALVVLDTIVNAVEPEIRKRKKKMEKAIAKYTEKYVK